MTNNSIIHFVIILSIFSNTFSWYQSCKLMNLCYNSIIFHRHRRVTILSPIEPQSRYTSFLLLSPPLIKTPSSSFIHQATYYCHLSFCLAHSTIGPQPGCFCCLATTSLSSTFQRQTSDHRHYFFFPASSTARQ